jgi:hypothetical protein
MERKLAAILCADVYGYSRLMGEDEEAGTPEKRILRFFRARAWSGIGPALRISVTIACMPTRKRHAGP